jgi:hypothetical protein
VLVASLTYSSYLFHLQPRFAIQIELRAHNFMLAAVGYLAHPPKFVWLNRNFKKRYDANPSFRHILQISKYKKPTFEGRFLSSVAQNVTLSGPDGDRNRGA